MSTSLRPRKTTYGTERYPLAALRREFIGVLIANGGFTRDTATRALSAGTADAVAFGKLFLANSDLPERFRSNAPLNGPDQSTFYGGAEKGYTDYPALASELVQG
jgi:N-ethylmaleimide reductase